MCRRLREAEGDAWFGEASGHSRYPDGGPVFIRIASAGEALEMNERYGAAQDMRAVRKKWWDDPFYGPFCH